MYLLQLTKIVELDNDPKKLMFLKSIQASFCVCVFFLLNAANTYAEDVSVVDSLIGRINQYIINPILQLAFGVALVIFLYGVLEFFLNPENTENHSKGKEHMLWGIIGMFIMMGAIGILQIISASIGGYEVRV